LGCLIGLFLLAQTAFAAPEDGLILSQPLAVVWRYQTDFTTNLTPAADAQTVFVPLGGGVMIALNAADGKLIWRAENGGEFSAAPIADERSVYIVSSYSASDEKHPRGALRAISKSTGITLWMRTLPAPIGGGLVVGAALFGGSNDGRVYAFDKHTGAILWSNQYAEGFSSQPAIAGNLVYFGGNAGTMRALNTATGQLGWEYKARGAIQGSISAANGVVYFGSSDANVYAFSESRSKLIWHRRTGAAVQAVTALENGLLASSLDNFAYLLSLNKGAVIWRRQLPGRISSPPVTSADGALFTPFSTDTAIVLNLRDGRPANSLPMGEENSSAAAPIRIGNLVLITTPHTLLAFAAPRL
jgi:outer membrane protein assembly factor BamB